MRETAVFAYVVAVFVAVATVVFGFVNIYGEHPTNALAALFIGTIVIGMLWSMAHWIESRND